MVQGVEVENSGQNEGDGYSVCLCAKQCVELRQQTFIQDVIIIT